MPCPHHGCFREHLVLLFLGLGTDFSVQLLSLKGFPCSQVPSGACPPAWVSQRVLTTQCRRSPLPLHLCQCSVFSLSHVWQSDEYKVACFWFFWKTSEVILLYLLVEISLLWISYLYALPVCLFDSLTFSWNELAINSLIHFDTVKIHPFKKVSLNKHIWLQNHHHSHDAEWFRHPTEFPHTPI